MQIRMALTGAATSLLLLTACSGGGSEDDTDREPVASSSTKASATPSEPSPTPSIAPASGKRLETQDALRFRAPAEGEGWVDIGDGGRTVTTSSYVEVGTVTINAAEFPTAETDLDAMAAAVQSTHGEFEKASGVTRQPNRVIGGREGWVFDGTGDQYRHYTFGTLHAGVFVNVDFRIPADLPASDELIESVLASIEWK